jgi:hypothetical protein
MKSQQTMEERLWEYIDGRGPATDRNVVEELIASSQEWRNKYQELLEVHKLLQASEIEAPSLRFTKNVMEEISRLQIAPATRSYINRRIVWGIGLFFITMVIGFLVYGFGQMNWTTTGEDLVTENIQKINLGNFFNNTWVNVFMMINVVLGLILLDNFLSNKKKQFKSR